jgi:PAS domain S-box-containing protein
VSPTRRRKPAKAKPKARAHVRAAATPPSPWSQDSFRAILDSTADGILVADGHGGIVSYNRKFVELWRLPDAVVETRDDDLALATVLEQLVEPSKFLDKVHALYNDLEAESFDVLEFKDGRVFERYSQPQREDGRVTGRVWSFRDVTERRRAEAALQESERRYRLVSDNIVDVVWTTDLDLRLTYVSPSVERVTGYTTDDLKAMPLERLLTPDSAAEARRNLREALEVNAARGRVGGRSLEVEVRRKDGSTVWVEFRISFLRDEGGVALGILGVARDISERKRAEDTLRSVMVATAAATGEEFFRTLVQHLAVALGIKYALAGELEGTERDRIRTLAVWAGDRFAENLEYALAGAPCRHVVDGNGVIAFPDRLRERFPDCALLADLGVESYMGIPLRESTGRVIGNLVVMHDAPMRHQPLAESLLTIFAVRAATELERRRTVQRLSLQSTVMESAANAIVITDTNGVIEWVNPAFTRLTGYTEAEAVGQNPRLLNSGKQSKAFYAELWRTIIAGTVWRGEVINRRKDGTLYTERMTITPVLSDPGSGGTSVVDRFVAIKEDVTERKAMEEQLRHVQRMEAVGRLAGGVAHDFNNLLQAMLALTQLSRLRGEDLATSAERLQDMEELLRRAAQLTQQLLLFSRRDEPKTEPFDLNEAIRDTAKLLRHLMRANVTVDLQLLAEPLPVLADRGQLGQVWMNLAVNGADAMPEGGVLTVRSGLDGDVVWFSVSDTGHGIADDIRDRIFEPFFTTKGDSSGTGLGLAVVHGIVTKHGGEVEVKSEPGQGATFKVILPRHPVADERVTTPKTGLDALPAGAGQRVLLVEDNLAVRRAIERLLTRLHYDTTAVGSAEEAELLADAQPFDLLLTDMVLPGRSGSALANRLRGKRPHLPVVLMSGYTEDEIARDQAAKGEVRFLQKPVDLATLAREVRDALTEV